MAGQLDRYVHLLLREKLGSPAPDLTAGILDAIDAAQVEAPVAVKSAPLAIAPVRTLRPWMALAASIAIVAAVTLTVSAILMSRDNPVSPTAAGDNTVRVIPSDQDRANQQTPEPRPEPKPEPKPEPYVPDQVEKPEPQPEPDPQPEREAPKPEDDPVVETPPQPKPGPLPEPTPEPQPSKPDGSTVDKPEPTPEPVPDRPPTEAQPPKPVRLGTVLYMADRARLEFRLSAEAEWQDWVEGGEVLSGMQFRTRKAVAVQLLDGASLYFDGDITVSGDDTTCDVTLDDESVYFDVYGSKRLFTVRRGDAKLSFRDAEVLAEKSGLRLHVSCLGGEITSFETTLRAGWTASLTDEGFSREKFEGARARNNPLVNAMDDTFELVREEFTDDAAKRVYCGELKEGVVSGAGSKECSVGLELAHELVVAERGYLRMRIRVKGSENGLSVGFGSGKGSEWRYFQTGVERVKNDDWVIVTIPLSWLRDDGAKKAIAPGAVLHKFQIVLWNKEGSSVELDWVEFGVAPAWINLPEQQKMIPKEEKREGSKD